MKLATVIGALSSKSLHSSLPRSVSIVAESAPDPAMPCVASDKEKFPCSGSSGAGVTLATGRAATLGVGVGAGTGAATGDPVCEGGAAGVLCGAALAGSSLAGGVSARVDWQEAGNTK